MPWKKEHKTETRSRILETAASAMRAQGVAATGVAQVMEAAGLTHGGFYAHFGSKDDLVAQALAHACEQTGARLKEVAERAPAGEKLRTVAESYLSPHHARHPEGGCPIAALGPELTRGDAKSRAAFAQAVRSRLAWLEEVAQGDTRDERRRAAAGTYAAMLGGLLIARALGDEEGDKFLANVRRFLRE